MNAKSASLEPASVQLLFDNNNRISPNVLPTRLAAEYISKSPNALRIMKCRGLIREAGRLGKEKYYAICDLKKLLPQRR